jgi:hypothetical protein
MTSIVDCSAMWGRYHQMVPKLRALVETECTKAAKAGLSEARRGTFKDRTGALRGTLRWNIVGWTGATFRVSIAAPMPYAGFVEFGTAAHDIWPKAGYNASKASLRPGQTRRGRGKGPHEHAAGRGIALRWVDASGEHFARMVHHPGGKPYPFMFPAQIQAVHTLRDGLSSGFIGLQSIWSQSA